MAEPLRLLCFDLDDTLWPVRPVIIRAEHRLRNHLDAVAPQVHQRLGPEDFAAFREARLGADPTLRHRLSALRRLVLEDALRASGYEEAETLAAEAFEVFFDARNDVAYFEGTLEALEALSRRYTLAALSNGNADIRRLGLERIFAFHFNAEGVGAPKPQPAIFEAALQRAGLGPEQAVHIGDHAVDDVQGAAAVGMKTVWVNESGAPWPGPGPAPDWVVPNIPALLEIF
ncbi:MAG: HAD family hydrolase [Gammaproteobacteria bacterium]|jgi:putative hydrolase of the HAD superfamily|nr:HAD family hydrolase [Gammaproteobacteria bacterium]